MSIFSDDQLKDQFEQDLKAAQAAIEKPNILLLGNTGVGKSSP